jgi:hypothetical protein
MPLATVERMGEGLARVISRRELIRRIATSVFGIVAAGMAELAFTPSIQAKSYCQYLSNDTTCHPFSGKYCDAINPSYCSGADCKGDCTLDTSFWITGCWCTRKHCDLSQKVYVFYECCDCLCQSQQCGCHKSVIIAGISC